MLENKLLNIILIVVIATALLAIGGILAYMLLFDGKADPNTPPAEVEKSFTGTEIQELSIITEKITTNLADRRMIIISLSFLPENKKAKEELEQRTIQLKDIIITTLHGQTREDFESLEGLEAFKELILEQINAVMEKGKIVDVYYVEKIIQ